MKNKKIQIGWILIAVQVIAIFGMAVSGNTITSSQGSGSAVAEWIGFFVPSIVGIILLIKGYSLKNKTNVHPKNKNTKYAKSNTQNVEKDRDHDQQYRFFYCPRCGTKLRIPAGKGKVQIICANPKCRKSFQVLS